MPTWPITITGLVITNNNPVMRTTVILLCLLVGSCLAGCKDDKDEVEVIVDPPAFCYVTWKNNSEHEVLVSVVLDGDNHFHNPDTNRGFKIGLMPGGNFTAMTAGMGLPYTPFLFDVSVLFDETYGVKFWIQSEGNKVTFQPSDYEKRYHLTSYDNYTYETGVSPHGIPAYAAGTQWTYTFTNADYEAAVAYNAAK
jgi:hypothetical protein